MQKSGTSTLFRYLKQHPQLRASYRKEVHFFDGGLNPSVDDFAKGQAWYRSYFPTKKRLADGDKVFEASPLYVFNPLAPGRMAGLIPGVKLLLVLSREEMFADMEGILRRVFEFVGVTVEVPISKLWDSNVGWNKTEVEPQVHAYLKGYFRPHNQALYGLLGRDFGW